MQSTECRELIFQFKCGFANFSHIEQWRTTISVHTFVAYLKVNKLNMLISIQHEFFPSSLLSLIHVGHAIMMKHLKMAKLFTRYECIKTSSNQIKRIFVLLVCHGNYIYLNLVRNIMLKCCVCLVYFCNKISSSVDEL